MRKRASAVAGGSGGSSLGTVLRAAARGDHGGALAQLSSAGMVWILRRIHAELSAEPMPFDCERIVDSGVRRLITMEK